ncbi:unnamed protein product [Amoebophrya sp. A25]|nr:unnamed protein product [Amoebophrya sp. A25]|eukprot:GSA25T00016137001.1
MQFDASDEGEAVSPPTSHSWPGPRRPVSYHDDDGKERGTHHNDFVDAPTQEKIKCGSRSWKRGLFSSHSCHDLVLLDSASHFVSSRMAGERSLASPFSCSPAAAPSCTYYTQEPGVVLADRVSSTDRGNVWNNAPEPRRDEMNYEKRGEARHFAVEFLTSLVSLPEASACEDRSTGDHGVARPFVGVSAPRRRSSVPAPPSTTSRRRKMKAEHAMKRRQIFSDAWFRRYFRNFPGGPPRFQPGMIDFPTSQQLNCASHLPHGSTRIRRTPAPATAPDCEEKTLEGTGGRGRTVVSTSQTVTSASPLTSADKARNVYESNRTEERTASSTSSSNDAHGSVLGIEFSAHQHKISTTMEVPIISDAPAETDSTYLCVMWTSIRYATPNVFSSLLLIAPDTVNVLLSSQHGNYRNVAALGLGNLLLNSIALIVAQGINSALDRHASLHWTRGNFTHVYRCVALSAICCLLYLPLCVFVLAKAPRVLVTVLHQDPVTMEMAGSYIEAAVPGIPAFFLQETLRRFFTNIGEARRCQRWQMLCSGCLHLFFATYFIQRSYDSVEEGSVTASATSANAGLGYANCCTWSVTCACFLWEYYSFATSTFENVRWFGATAGDLRPRRRRGSCVKQIHLNTEGAKSPSGCPCPSVLSSSSSRLAEGGFFEKLRVPLLQEKTGATIPPISPKQQKADHRDPLFTPFFSRTVVQQGVPARTTSATKETFRRADSSVASSEALSSASYLTSDDETSISGDEDAPAKPREKEQEEKASAYDHFSQFSTPLRYFPPPAVCSRFQMIDASNSKVISSEEQAPKPVLTEEHDPFAMSCANASNLFLGTTKSQEQQDPHLDEQLHVSEGQQGTDCARMLGEFHLDIKSSTKCSTTTTHDSFYVEEEMNDDTAFFNKRRRSSTISEPSCFMNFDFAHQQLGSSGCKFWRVLREPEDITKTGSNLYSRSTTTAASSTSASSSTSCTSLHFPAEDDIFLVEAGAEKKPFSSGLGSLHNAFSLLTVDFCYGDPAAHGDFQTDSSSAGHDTILQMQHHLYDNLDGTEGEKCKTRTSRNVENYDRQEQDRFLQEPGNLNRGVFIETVNSTKTSSNSPCTNADVMHNNHKTTTSSGTRCIFSSQSTHDEHVLRPQLLALSPPRVVVLFPVLPGVNAQTYRLLPRFAWREVLPCTVNVVAEFAFWECLALCAGSVSPLALAIHMACINLYLVAFRVCTGIASAASYLVNAAISRTATASSSLLEPSSASHIAADSSCATGNASTHFGSEQRSYKLEDDQHQPQEYSYKGQNNHDDQQREREEKKPMKMSTSPSSTSSRNTLSSPEKVNIGQRYRDCLLLLGVLSWLAFAVVTYTCKERIARLYFPDVREPSSRSVQTKMLQEVEVRHPEYTEQESAGPTHGASTTSSTTTSKHFSSSISNSTQDARKDSLLNMVRQDANIFLDRKVEQDGGGGSEVDSNTPRKRSSSSSSSSAKVVGEQLLASRVDDVLDHVNADMSTSDLQDSTEQIRQIFTHVLTLAFGVCYLFDSLQLIGCAINRAAGHALFNAKLFVLQHYAFGLPLAMFLLLHRSLTGLETPPMVSNRDEKGLRNAEDGVFTVWYVLILDLSLGLVATMYHLYRSVKLV